jgi:single-strand DNA-binding protein
VILWGRRAEGTLKDYLKKGQQVFVSGELTMNEYTANDGTKKTNLELNATIIDLVGKRESAASDYNAPAPVSSYAPSAHQPAPAAQAYAPPPAPSYTPPQPRPAAAPSFNAPYDDDIPF